VIRAAFLRFAAVAVALVSVAGCNPNAKECEAICRRFVSGCGFGAWSSVEQCQSGCVEDMYRRTDVDAVMACYEAAVDAPTREQAEAKVDAAIDGGFFGLQVADGTFDRESLVVGAIESGTCDVFAVIQCKVEAVQERPSGPFIQ